MSKKIKYEKKVGYLWNSEIGNYCLAENMKIIYPLEPLELRTITDRISFIETLQMIFYKRYGKINYKIGTDKDYEIELAKKMNVW